MDEIKAIIKQKIKICAVAISNLSTPQANNAEAEAIEHLARAYSYLNQINESEEK